MPRRAAKKICCVCLSTTLHLNKLSLKDENNMNLQIKLKTCISEIVWLASYQICEPCTNLLNIVYTFRETCLKSDLTRKQQLGESKTNNDELPNKDSNAKVEEPLNKSGTVFYNPITDHVKQETTDDETYETQSEGSDDNSDENCPSDTADKSDDEEVKGEQKFKRKRKTQQFACEKCDNIFNSSIKLIDHCVSDHQMDIKDVRPFVCDRCPSRFCKSSNLLQHVKYHDAVRSNMCTYCGKGFITKTDLNIHEKQHLNRREYRCDECGKCFNTHKDIRSHKLVVHTDSSNWKYCCKVCFKKFPIKSNYDSHMRRHTGDKKFVCHLCERKFTDKCVLQRHMRTHSNVREYKCSHCDKEYKDHRVMRVHMAKIHGIGIGQIKLPEKERKYICHICPKAYYAKNKLTRHLYTHSGEKPYDCPICGKKFNDKSYVKQHLKKTHNLDQAPGYEENKLNFNEIVKDEKPEVPFLL